ncbi:TPA: acinetobactin non-ribosomal peptide synthetase subunit BasB, partial [Acinetobacter baumannii]
MLQLQQPEQVNRRFNLWKLNQGLDIQLLIKAIQDIIKTTPDLNVRYTFSDEGDLYKYPFDDHSACLEVKKSNAEQVFEQVAALKAQAWNAEFHPPFFTSLIETEQDYFLILALHPILDESYQKSDFIQAIQNRYQQYSPNNVPLVLTEIDISNHLASSTKAPEQPNQTYVSEIILEEFRNTLAEPEMSQHDDFFDFGGHSLLATRIIGNLLNKHGIEIQFNDFFKSPSAADLAQYAFVKSAKTEKTTLQSVDKAPLTLAQDFLWQAYSAFDFSPIYNLPFAVEFLEEINEDVFLQAFTDIVERHAGLRTIFNSANGQTYQQVVPTSELKKFKWFWNSAESHDATLASEASYKFDLTRELPLRIRLIQNAKGRQTLSFLVHHMVIDEWSLNTIMADLAHAYLARSNAQAPNWKAPAQSILDFSLLQQKQGINQDHLNYWTNLLTGATKGLNLPVSEHELNAEKEKPPVQWLELKFAPEMHEKLLAFSRQHSSSIFAVLYTAIAHALQQQGN